MQQDGGVTAKHEAVCGQRRGRDALREKTNSFQQPNRNHYGLKGTVEITMVDDDDSL